MADRHWVNGAGTWDAANTANWSATAGGAGGASAPTAADNVFFSSTSNAAAATITVGATAACLNWNISTPTNGMLTFSAAGTSVINVNGTFNNTATNNVTMTGNGVVNFKGEGTLRFGSATYGSTTFRIDTTAGAKTYTLGSTLTSTSTVVNVLRGHLDTAGYNVSLSALQAGTLAGATSMLSLGTSTISCLSLVELNNTGTLTVNAGTSRINLTSANATLNNAGYTLYDVSFTAKGTGQIQIRGASGTYNSLTVDSPSTAGVITLVTQSNSTGNTLTLGTSNTPDKVIVVRGDLVKRIMTFTTVTALANVSFSDIEAQGASAPWSGTRLSDCGGNTNILFDTGVTRYWYSAGQAAATWRSASWCNSPADTVGSLANVPLAQDTVVFRDAGLNSGAVLTSSSTDRIEIGTLDCSQRTLPMNLNRQGEVSLYGDIILSPAVTWGLLANTLRPSGKGAMNITSAGVSFWSIQTYTSNPSVLKLVDDMKCTSSFGQIGGGTVNLNGRVLTCTAFTTSTALPRSVDFTGGAVVRVTGTNTTVYNTTTSTGLTYIGAPRVELRGSPTTGTRSVTAGTPVAAAQASFYVLGGNDTVNIFTAVKSLDFTGFNGTITSNNWSIGGDLTLSPTATLTTTTNTITFAGSGASTLTLNGVALQRKILSYREITVTDLNPTFKETLTLNSGGLILQAGGTATFTTIQTQGSTVKTMKSTNPAVRAKLVMSPWTPHNLSLIQFQGIEVDKSQGATFNAYTNSGNALSAQNQNLGNNIGINFIPPGMTMMGFM
jgi:hypothetical protein